MKKLICLMLLAALILAGCDTGSGTNDTGMDYTVR
jgi:predicted small secreted protein